MIITCPACDRRYLTEEQSLGQKGREVRCVGCHHQWFQEIIKQAEPADSVFSDFQGEAFETYQRSSWRGPALFFLALLFIAMGLGGIYLKREKLIEIFPNTAKYFEVFGLSPAKADISLVIEQINPLKIVDGHEDKMMIAGEIRNISEGVKQLPSLHITVLGSCNEASWTSRFSAKLQNLSNNCVLDQWDHNWKETRLPPGESIGFETPLRRMIKGMTSIRVDF